MAAIESMRDEYRRGLLGPTDGMWEGAIIGQATCWELRDGERQAGFFCLDAGNTLLRFHLTDAYRAQGRRLFGWVVAHHAIRQAIASTIEPLYFSLCLDSQVEVRVHSYLFRDHTRVAPPPAAPDTAFRPIEEQELDGAIHFYRTNTTGSGDWIERFLRERVAGGELFGLYQRGTLIAAGECIPSREHPPYADLGVLVAAAKRSQGVGAGVLVRLKERCCQAGWEPICSCAADNTASRRAIEKAGFLSEHRIVRMVLASDDAGRSPGRDDAR